MQLKSTGTILCYKENKNQIDNVWEPQIQTPVTQTLLVFLLSTSPERQVIFPSKIFFNLFNTKVKIARRTLIPEGFSLFLSNEIEPRSGVNELQIAIMIAELLLYANDFRLTLL